MRPTRFSSDPGIVHNATIVWDFATDGGATGTDVLPGTLPMGAIVVGGVVESLIQPASADDTATSKFVLDEVDLTDALAADAYDPAVPIPLANIAEATPLPRLSADSQVSIVKAVQAFTAGRIALHLRYIVPAEIDL